MTDSLAPLTNRHDTLQGIWAPEPVDDRSSGDDLVEQWSASGPFKGEDPLKGVSRESLKMEKARFMADIRLAFQERGSHLAVIGALARAAGERPSMLPAILQFLDDELFPQCPNLKALFNELLNTRTPAHLYEFYAELVNSTLSRVALVICLNADGSTHYPLPTVLSAIVHWLDAIAAFPDARTVSHYLDLLSIFAERNPETKALFSTFTKGIPNYESLSTREKIALLRASACQLGLQGAPPLPLADLPSEIPILDCEEVCRGRQTVDRSTVEVDKRKDTLLAHSTVEEHVFSMIILFLANEDRAVRTCINKRYSTKFKRSLAAVLPFAAPNELHWTLTTLLGFPRDPLCRDWFFDVCAHVLCGEPPVRPVRSTPLLEITFNIGVRVAFPLLLWRFIDGVQKGLPCPAASSEYFLKLTHTYLRLMVTSISKLPPVLYGPFHQAMCKKHNLSGSLDNLDLNLEQVRAAVLDYTTASSLPLVYFLLDNTPSDLRAGKGCYKGQTVDLTVENPALTLADSLTFGAPFDLHSQVCPLIASYLDPDADHKKLLQTPLNKDDGRMIDPRQVPNLLKRPEHAALLLQEPLLSVLRKHIATQHDAIIPSTNANLRGN